MMIRRLAASVTALALLGAAAPHLTAQAPASWDARFRALPEASRIGERVEEPAAALDPTSSQTAEQLPTYNAYSADGDVTAPLVYVNYGRPEDYEKTLLKIVLHLCGLQRDLFWCVAECVSKYELLCS